MKVIHLSKYYKPYCGGVESVVSGLAEYQVRDHQVQVIAAGGNAFLSNENISGVSVCRCRSRVNLFSTPISVGYFVAVSKFVDADIVHIHLPNPLANMALWFRSLFKQKEGKWVVHWHSDIVKQKKLLSIYRPFMNWLLSRADIIIATSPNYLKGSDQLAPFRSKCVVVPLGGDDFSDKVDPKLVCELRKLYEGKKIVFSLGRHIYYKGFEYLIKAAKSLPQTVVLIGGSGPDTKRYSDLINEYGLVDRVILLGRIDEQSLPSYFAAADVYCLPSTEKSEAFGVVQLEAMSLGIPVVSTAIPGSGVAWVNQHDVSGLICAPRSVEALAEALLTLLSDNNRRAALSVGARARFLDEFTNTLCAERVSTIYQDIHTPGKRRESM